MGRKNTESLYATEPNRRRFTLSVAVGFWEQYFASRVDGIKQELGRIVNIFEPRGVA